MEVTNSSSQNSSGSSSEDPMLNYKAFFILKNHDEAD
jgi:hypothetical protein